jgi:putative nucleotidyltransferase with HDIG domain
MNLERLIKNMGYSVTGVVNSGERALETARNEEVDLILMDITLNGGLDGIAAAVKIREEKNIPIIFTTAHDDDFTIARTKDALPYGYIVKPYNERELRTIIQLAIHRYNLELKLEESYRKMKSTLNGAIHAIAKVLEVRDPYTAGHQRRVGNLARAMAGKMGFTSEELDLIHIAGTIHDIGKISVPAEILSKPTRLSESEFMLLKSHPVTGYEILSEIELPDIIAKIVYQHHERLDGSGYPNGLSDRDIALESKIIAVADVVEAMASHRPYRPALGISKAMEEIRKQRGTTYDRDAVDACVELFEKDGFICTEE